MFQLCRRINFFYMNFMKRKYDQSTIQQAVHKHTPRANDLFPAFVPNVKLKQRTSQYLLRSKSNIPIYKPVRSKANDETCPAAIASAVVVPQNNFKQLFNNSLWSYRDSVRKRNEFDFDNFYKLHFFKIIMTVFILIKHYTFDDANNESAGGGV